MVEIKKIHYNIGKLFEKYKIPAITLNLPIEELGQWACRIAEHFKLDQDNFRQSVTELFWSVGYVQLSLGYILIARQSCNFPKGIHGEAFREEDIPLLMEIPEMHFWLHIYSCYEGIYRCWERIATVLQNVCFPEKSKRYFDKIINDLSKDVRYKNNKSLKKLQRQVKNWSKIAEIRNGLSHKKSSPFRNINIEGVLSNTLDINGFPIPKLIYSSKNLIQETKHIIEKYLKILPAIIAMKEFIDTIGYEKMGK